MPKLKRRKHLRFDSLEDRRVPATWGIPWADPQHLTASFVPDGTTLPGQGTSQLFQTLDAELGAGKWESTILKALQTWAVNSNINIGVVSDGGQPLGTAGPAQGDARFGDIRISAEPLPAGVVAITAPYSPGGGTLSGDIILNSNYDFNPSHAGSYDLFTVALHEAGHVFGFADSSDPSSFMYDVYQGPKTSLAPGAIPAIQALYGGPRNIDAIDGNASSTSPYQPVTITKPAGISTSVTLPGDLTSAQSSNYFAFKAPSLLAAPLGLDVTIQTAGLSLLAPKVTVYDPFGNAIATASVTNPLTGGTTVHLPLLLSGLNYTIRVQGATGDVFSVGSYDLTVAATLSEPVQANSATGVQAIPQPVKYDGSTPLTVSNSIGQPTQQDLYSFKTPSSLLNTVTVNLQDWGVGLVAPSITIYNAIGLIVGSATASNASTQNLTVHLTSLLPNSKYYLLVTTGTANALDFGTYQASVSIGLPAMTTTPSSSFVLATPWFGPNGGGNTSPNVNLANAATLQSPAGVAPNSVYDAIDGIAASQPQQFFKLTAPSVASGQSQVMTVAVETLGTSGLLPWIGVFDQNGNALNSQVLTEQDGIAVIQVALPSPGSSYFLEVSSAQVGGAQASGNYFVTTTFGSTLATIGPISSGTLAAAPAGSPTSLMSTTLTVASGGLYSFVLDGSTSNPPTDAILQMTLLDSSGNVVATLSTPASLAESMIVTLPAGNFTVLIGAYSPSGQPIPQLAYSLSGTNLTDPIKVAATSGSGGATPGR